MNNDDLQELFQFFLNSDFYYNLYRLYSCQHTYDCQTQLKHSVYKFRTNQPSDCPFSLPNQKQNFVSSRATVGRRRMLLGYFCRLLNTKRCSSLLHIISITKFHQKDKK